MNYYFSGFWAPSDYLMHHGILGQKWGVRRYQNADGTLTAAGHRRYYGKADKIQNDIDSFKGVKNGISTKSGKQVLTAKDVSDIVNGLESQRDKSIKKGDLKREKDKKRIDKYNQKKAYRSAQKERYKELGRINAEYDSKRTENAFGLNSGKVSDRLKGHLENEYKRQKAINEWDQRNLDAKREYRISIGKKKTDTLLMKWQQQSIDDIAKQSQAEFNKDYIKNLLNEAYKTAVSYNEYNQKRDDD